MAQGREVLRGASRGPSCRSTSTAQVIPLMARNFVDGLGYTVHCDILLVKDCNTTWGSVENIWWAGNRVPHDFDPVFNVKQVEEQRKDPNSPSCSSPSLPKPGDWQVP